MDNFIELRQVIRILLRRWWLLVIGAVLAGAIGYYVSLIQTPVYEAATTMIVGRSTTAVNLERSDIQLSQQLAITYADFVRRRPVLKGAIDALGLSDSWQELRNQVQVKAVEGTQLFEIHVNADSPTKAKMIADEIAQQLILLGPAASQTQQEETKQFVEQRLQTLQDKIETGQRRLATLETQTVAISAGSISQLTKVQADIRELEALLTEWDDTYARLLAFVNTELPVNHLAVVEPAEASLKPIRPRVQLNLLVAVLVGLCLAGGLSFLLEHLDDRLKSPSDVSQFLGLVTLGGVSRIKGKSIQDRLIFRQDVFSPASEDYRLLRNKIQVMSADWPHRIIMVTSPIPSEMKSMVVANLGIVLAQAGHKVIIVDANLRQPVQHVIFQIPNRHGLAELLYSPKLEFDGHLQKTEVGNLQVLTVGALPPSYPSEILGSMYMGDLLRRLAQHADIVLCDSAQATTIADAAVLSGQVDGVVLVLEAGKTRRGVAEQAVDNLQQAGAHLLGVVLSPLAANKRTVTRFKAPIPPTTNGQHPNGNERSEYESIKRRDRRVGLTTTDVG